MCQNSQSLAPAKDREQVSTRAPIHAPLQITPQARARTRKKTRAPEDVLTRVMGEPVSQALKPMSTQSNDLKSESIDIIDSKNTTVKKKKSGTHRPNHEPQSTIAASQFGPSSSTTSSQPLPSASHIRKLSAQTTEQPKIDMAARPTITLEPSRQNVPLAYTGPTVYSPVHPGPISSAYPGLRIDGPVKHRSPVVFSHGGPSANNTFLYIRPPPRAGPPAYVVTQRPIFPGTTQWPDNIWVPPLVNLSVPPPYICFAPPPVVWTKPPPVFWAIPPPVIRAVAIPFPWSVPPPVAQTKPLAVSSAGAPFPVNSAEPPVVAGAEHVTQAAPAPLIARAGPPGQTAPDTSGRKCVPPGQTAPDTSGRKCVPPGQTAPDTSGRKCVPLSLSLTDQTGERRAYLCCATCHQLSDPDEHVVWAHECHGQQPPDAPVPRVYTCVPCRCYSLANRHLAKHLGTLRHRSHVDVAYRNGYQSFLCHGCKTMFYATSKFLAAHSCVNAVHPRPCHWWWLGLPDGDGRRHYDGCERDEWPWATAMREVLASYCNHRDAGGDEAARPALHACLYCGRVGRVPWDAAGVTAGHIRCKWCRRRDSRFYCSVCRVVFTGDEIWYVMHRASFEHIFIRNTLNFPADSEQ